MTYQFWEKCKIYAVAIEESIAPTISLLNISHLTQIQGSRIGSLTDDIPYSNQIIKAKNSHNLPADRSFNISTDK